MINPGFCLFVIFNLALASGCKISPSSNVSGEDLTGKQAKNELNQAEKYAAACSQKGVVLPQPIGRPGFWTEKRSINTKYTHFAAGMGTGNMFIHSGQQGGGCLELITSFPGGSSDSAVAFAICWSAKGSVCFWEEHESNVRDLNSTFEITKSETASPYSEGNFNNNCIGCHRGDNPFVGHGSDGDPTFNDFPHVSPSWKPIVPEHWFEGKSWEDLQRGDESYQCAAGCHSVPKLSEYDGFCTTGMSMMYSGYMLGKELQIKDSLGEKPVPAVFSTDLLDKETAEKCLKWRNFLTACGQTKFFKNDLGICAK